MSRTITVNALPVAGVIIGPSFVCAAAIVTLTETAIDGIWSATNGAAVISGGTVLGIHGGLDTMSYSVTKICGSATATAVVSVGPLAYSGTISGRDSICIGDHDTLVTSVAGGTWLLSNAIDACASNNAYFALAFA
jgi:hypothetical protein